VLEANISREWVVNVGRRSRHHRLAHLLCEIFTRLDAVGLTRATEFNSPLTQTELADPTRLSTVHVNRVPQDLQRDGLIQWEGSTVAVPDWDALVRRGEFDPADLSPWKNEQNSMNAGDAYTESIAAFRRPEHLQLARGGNERNVRFRAEFGRPCDRLR
jgi:hypothetical protein